MCGSSARSETSRHAGRRAKRNKRRGLIGEPGGLASSGLWKLDHNPIGLPCQNPVAHQKAVFAFTPLYRVVQQVVVVAAVRPLDHAIGVDQVLQQFLFVVHLRSGNCGRVRRLAFGLSLSDVAQRLSASVERVAILVSTGDDRAGPSDRVRDKDASGRRTKDG